MTTATCRHGSHPGAACRECARAADRLNQPIGHDQPRDRTMTASEAREDARRLRGLAADRRSPQTKGYPTMALMIADIWVDAQAMDRAAVALDAYADGIDARPTSADTNRLHRIRARLLDLVPLDGTMSLADDVQRLDRALADAAAREREACAAICDAEVADAERENDDDGRAAAKNIARAIRARGAR